MIYGIIREKQSLSFFPFEKFYFYSIIYFLIYRNFKSVMSQAMFREQGVKKIII